MCIQDFDRLLVFSPPTVLATPTLKALTYELKSVTDWYTLGVSLGLKRDQLKAIEKDYHHDNNRCMIEMLACWIENTLNPTWEAVAKALNLMKLQEVADTIRRKCMTSTTTTTDEGIVLL